ncbi:MAG: PhaM family polyhydroxyalkanoate granule multifunctional regulatory protein [Bordetella sp.]|uniref:PhaM family polyhydroxyalkanoate granule multifunctional regulatory protein n=1 Tax=Bordetella sp. TaxID=28081 RepID=UPI003F7BAD21
MSDSSHTNPFVLPGLGQSSDASGNPFLASMEMMRQAWAGLAGEGGFSQVLPMGTTMNVEELDRRIAELRSVESWLRMNLSMLDSAIQGMEVQRATITTLKSFVGKMSSMDPMAAAAALGGSAPKDAGASFSEAAQSASAWWNLLQQQFSNIAAATAAGMPGAEQSAASAPKPAAKSTRKKAGARQAAPGKSSAPSSDQS